MSLVTIKLIGTDGQEHTLRCQQVLQIDGQDLRSIGVPDQQQTHARLSILEMTVAYLGDQVQTVIERFNQLLPVLSEEEENDGSEPDSALRDNDQLPERVSGETD